MSEKLSFVDRIKKFFEEVYREFNKVNWPDHEKLMNSTFVVIVISVIFTLFIYLADILVSTGVQWIYG